MTTVSKNAAPVKTHRSKAKAEATRRGLLYALPDWLMIIMLFFVPIVLLVIMAGSRWSLMGGNRGWNFPENFVKVFENKLLGQSVLFTLEYTVIVTIFLLVLGLGLALIVQESTKWNNMLRTCFLLPSATGLASASLLFYALYSPQVGPVTKILSFFGLMDEGGSVLATGQSALWATIIVIVWCWHVAHFPFHHPAADEADHRDVPDLLRHRFHPRVRPVLHSDQGRSEQFHHDRSAAHLQLRIRFQEGSGHGGRTVADRAWRELT